MAKKKNVALDELISQIQQTGSYFIPKGGVTTDAALAAYHGHPSTRRVLEDYFFPDDQPGVKAVRSGNRIVCTTDAFWEWIAANEQPLERMKRGRNLHGSTKKKRTRTVPDDGVPPQEA